MNLTDADRQNLAEYAAMPADFSTWRPEIQFAVDQAMCRAGIAFPNRMHLVTQCSVAKLVLEHDEATRHLADIAKESPKTPY